jgi:hypothetical protein
MDWTPNVTTEAIVVDVKLCARCGGEHRAVRFTALAHFVGHPLTREVLFTHWAECPVSCEPILLASQGG